MSTGTFVIQSGGIEFTVNATFAWGRGGVDPAFEIDSITLDGSEIDLTHVLHPKVLTPIEEFLAETAAREAAESRQTLHHPEYS